MTDAEAASPGKKPNPLVKGIKSIVFALRDEANHTGGYDLPPVSEEEIASFDREKFKGFDRVGYARPLGGWFYQFFYALLGAGVVVVFYPFMLGILYPEPESKAYVDVAGVLFSILFFAFNIPTNFAIERWVGDYRIKNPTRMVQYMSFYIWYQMMSGLILVTSMTIRTDMQVQSLSFTASSAKRDVLDVSLPMAHLPRPGALGKLLDATSIGIGALADWGGQ